MQNQTFILGRLKCPYAQKCPSKSGLTKFDNCFKFTSNIFVTM